MSSLLTSLKPGYYLGIDCSGSHTEAVIADESGFILGSGGCETGANPHNTSLESIFEAIRTSTMEAQKDATRSYPERDIKHYEAACIGMAGFDTPNDQERIRKSLLELPSEQRFHLNRIIIVNDGLAALRAGTDRLWGISLLAGTGSSCYAISPSGKEAKAGGWGFLLGDQGSGYAIGKAIIQQVVKELDGRARPTKLTAKVLKDLRLKEPSDLVQWAYGSATMPIRETAALSILYEDRDLANCIELADIGSQAINELILAFDAVIQQVSFPPGIKIPVVLSGGLFAAKGRILSQVSEAITNRCPQADIIHPTRSSAEGAVNIAQAGERLAAYSESAILMINPDK